MPSIVTVEGTIYTTPEDGYNVNRNMSGFFTKILESSKHILKCYVFKCVLCGVLINVHGLVLKMQITPAVLKNF